MYVPMYNRYRSLNILINETLFKQSHRNIYRKGEIHMTAKKCSCSWNKNEHAKKQEFKQPSCIRKLLSLIDARSKTHNIKFDAICQRHQRKWGKSSYTEIRV